jgi:hypothetical protein
MFPLPMSALPSTPLLRLGRFLIAMALVLGLATGVARAQVVDPNMWGTNGYVSAVATAENSVYLGGSFTFVGPNTGAFVGIDTGTGTPQTGWPRVEGYVFCSAPDGAGGWYIGGGFTAVGGVARTRLAHILADKTLDDWNPGANGTVFSLSVSGSIVYVGASSAAIQLELPPPMLVKSPPT